MVCLHQGCRTHILWLVVEGVQHFQLVQQSLRVSFHSLQVQQSLRVSFHSLQVEHCMHSHNLQIEFIHNITIVTFE